MLSLFRFRRSKGPIDFAVGMCGVRMGERLLAVGAGAPDIVAAVASKVGLTGQATAVVETAEDGRAMEQAAARAGVLIDVVVAVSGAWPSDLRGFDVALIDANTALAGDDGPRSARLAATRDAVRQGGRVVAVFHRSRSLAGRLGFEGASTGGAQGQSMQDALGRAGFGPVRFLADREGLMFVEAFRPRD